MTTNKGELDFKKFNLFVSSWKRVMLLLNHKITMTKQTNTFPAQIITELTVFTAIGAAIVAIVPNFNLTKYLSWISTDERRLKLGVTAYLLFVITALLLWGARKALKLPLSWFMYATMFNGLIIFIKFISSPNTYGKLSSTSLIATAAGVGLLYIFGATCVYLFSQGKILKSLSSASKSSEEVKLLFAAGTFVFVNFLRIVIFLLPPFSKTATATYLSSIFQGGGLILSIILFLIILGVVEAFDRAKNDKTTLRNVYILSVSMIIIFHVLWAIFVRSLGVCGC